MKNLLRRLAVGLMGLTCCAYAAEWELYHAPGDDAAELRRQVQPLLPAGTTLQLVALPADAPDTAALHLHARAISAGVSQLPCLVLRDAQGAYAALTLRRLTAEVITHAQAQAGAPGRAEHARHRSLLAKLYYLHHSMQRSASPAEQARLIENMYKLMQHPEVAAEMQQFIGLHCLYPALMQQYSAGYTGAHTPATEAKLLEAIRVLEQVRDAAPGSVYGRRAHAEREKLRAARLKSRRYE